MVFINIIQDKSMKTQEEIEEIVNEVYGEYSGYHKASFTSGYTQCQEDMTEQIKIIAKKVWEDIFNNESLIYNNFEDYYNDKLNKQD